MRYRVLHRTTYAYTQPVSVCHHLLHLRPRACAAQRCESTLLAIEPQPAVLTERRDYFGNPASLVAGLRAAERHWRSRSKPRPNKKARQRAMRLIAKSSFAVLSSRRLQRSVE